MQMNSYQQIKQFILGKLQNVNGVLETDRIHKEIMNIQGIISEFGPEIFARMLSVERILPLSNHEWNQMQRELETYFDVQMENGILIKGEEQQQRDTTWWSGEQKQKCENYYWNRYKQYIGKSLPDKVVRTIDKDTDNVMDNIGDPTFENFSRYGMVVGHVQSGKTANYSALICKAADAGYKFIVVIAGGINNLRNQTQERLNESFIGRDKEILVGVGKLGNLKRELLPISLTTAEKDFNKQDANRNAQGLNLDNSRSPIVLVIKKHTNTLSNVIKWLEAQYKNQIANHAMLLIDDESDYASINTKDEDDPTTINKKLRKLLNLFRKSVYVAYTATPYANIFIDHEVNDDTLGKDLFPEDFIYALKAPTNYFGARKIFLDTNNKHLIEIDDYLDVIPPEHKKDFELFELPESLYDAIRLFIINVAIRYLRNQGNKHNSMLIHVTRFTMVHQKIAMYVDNYIEDIRKDINAYGRLHNATLYSNYINKIKETYETKYLDLEFDWQDILKGICKIIDTIIVREVHQDKRVPQLEYRKDRVTNAIVIGGTSVSRGYTLEGLSVSYFLRNTVFYDTLMQMGRWFGYRPDYEDLCKIYMSPTMIDNFALIIEATEDLMDSFERMHEAKMTPNDFGLAVKQHPDSGLQVTARNKQKNSKNIYFEMKLDGHAKETSWIHKDTRINNENLETIKETIRKLQDEKYDYFEVGDKDIGNRHLWRDVDKTIISEFLDKFKVYSSDQFALKSRMPIDFVKKYVTDIDTKWDIALYSGEGEKYSIGNIKINKEKRKINSKDKRDKYYEFKNRQVSSGSAEAIVFFDEIESRKLGSNRKNIREKMKKPLLMLHIIDGSILDTNEKKENLVAFGISFPGGIKSNKKNITLKINTVYIKNIQELLNEEEFDD